MKTLFLLGSFNPRITVTFLVCPPILHNCIHILMMFNQQCKFLISFLTVIWFSIWYRMYDI